MSPRHESRPGYVVTYPNREKAGSRVARTLVVAILALSIVLMLVLTIGGWSKLAGLIPVNLLWCAVYLVFSYYVWGWARGLLPITAALATLMLTSAVIAATSLTGVTWSDRAAPGFAPAHTPFGGVGLGAQTMSTLVIVLAGVQAVLVVVAMRAFAQRWNIEFEIPVGEQGDETRQLERR